MNRFRTTYTLVDNEKMLSVFFRVVLKRIQMSRLVTSAGAKQLAMRPAILWMVFRNDLGQRGYKYLAGARVKTT